MLVNDFSAGEQARPFSINNVFQRYGYGHALENWIEEETELHEACPCLPWALEYIGRGWDIFPADLRNGAKKSYKSGKHSNGRNWGMTCDPVEARGNFKRWPKAGIGIPTGEVNQIFVVECDTKAGHSNLEQDGAQSLAALEEKHGKLPETLMAISPSGSVHRYFKYPGRKVRSSSSSIAVGVDVKGDGGMVVAPPSQRHDGVYRWLNWETPIAEATPWHPE
jgi:putative DNA primase/helicase